MKCSFTFSHGVVDDVTGRPRGLWALDRRKVAYSLVDRINPCSTIYDFEQLDSLHNIMANKHISVVGGGFLGKDKAIRRFICGLW